MTEVDRIRIHDDLEQLQELLSRKQAIWQDETDPAKRDELLSEMEVHTNDLNTLKAQLAAA